MLHAFGNIEVTYKSLCREQEDLYRDFKLSLYNLSCTYIAIIAALRRHRHAFHCGLEESLPNCTTHSIKIILNSIHDRQTFITQDAGSTAAVEELRNLVRLIFLHVIPHVFFIFFLLRFHILLGLSIQLH